MPVPPCRTTALAPFHRRAKMQEAVKQALREWFEAARNGAEGVSGDEVADAVITLGLNHDYKHVRQTTVSTLVTQKADSLLE